MQAVWVNLPPHVGKAVRARRGFGWRLRADEAARVEVNAQKVQRLPNQVQVAALQHRGIATQVLQDVGGVLTPEQRVKFEAMQPSSGRGGEGGKSGGVWVLDAKGKPDRRFVRTSTGDEEFAALRGGQLKAGDKVITGEVVPDEDAAK